MELLCDGRIKIYNVEFDESVFWFVFKAFEPVDNRLCAPPLEKLGFIAHSVVDFVKIELANFSDFGFSWVDEPAFGVANEVWFMVLESNKCFLLRERLDSIV